MEKEKIPISALALTETEIHDICHCKYIDGLGNTQIGRYFKLTCKEVSNVIKKTKEFKAWIVRDGKWIPVYYKVDGKRIVSHSVGKKTETK